MYSGRATASTGILPFVIPVHAGSDASNLSLLALYPLQVVLAALRTIIFGLLLGLHQVVAAILPDVSLWLP